MSEETAAGAREPTATAASGGGAHRARVATWAGAALLGVLIVGAVAFVWLRRAPTPPSLEEGERLMAARQFGQAERVAKALVDASPIDPRGLFLLASARAGLKDVKGTADALSRVPDWSVRKPEALYRAGLALRILNRGREAEESFLACLVRDPDGIYGLDSRVELLKLYALEERKDAFRAQAWETYDRIPPRGRLPILVMRMRVEFEQAKPEINTKQLQPMVEADPDDPEAAAGLASARDQASEEAAARTLFEKALAARPRDVELRERYLDLLYRMGDLAALKHGLAGREQGTEKRPRTAKFLAIADEKEGDLTAAARYYALATEADPLEPEYPYRLAQVLNRLGRKDEAAARLAEHTRRTEAKTALRKAWNDFADAFESVPSKITPELVLGMAHACETIGWRREATAWYREVLMLAPDNAQARAGVERLQAPAVSAEPRGS
ncbi:MAG TPA: tetratricopeptide repeat protein [Isosphaeraceae bacterium]|jgi:Tfp pilus assembly protein PilF|nr:tetratricopeptide repeat protein [Isosphaeraceae bacterium]